jgi:alkanesulfonate monooxygenase SsuD/methylene tetrahydromethanopterin reductase-like flavin-dependent oxidoreductase (luciferase family)
MLRIVARHADEWNSWGHVETATWKRDAFQKACDAEGRDPDSMHTSVQALIVITDDAELIERTRSGGFADRTLAGSAGQIVDAIGALEALGFDEFIVPDGNLGRDRTQRRERLELINAEIVSQFAGV